MPVESSHSSHSFIQSFVPYMLQRTFQSSPPRTNERKLITFVLYSIIMSYPSDRNLITRGDEHEMLFVFYRDVSMLDFEMFVGWHCIWHD